MKSWSIFHAFVVASTSNQNLKRTQWVTMWPKNKSRVINQKGRLFGEQKLFKYQRNTAYWQKYVCNLFDWSCRTETNQKLTHIKINLILDFPPLPWFSGTLSLIPCDYKPWFFILFFPICVVLHLFPPSFIKKQWYLSWRSAPSCHIAEAFLGSLHWDRLNNLTNNFQMSMG